MINAWWSIVFYPATDAPKFTRGMIAMLCVSVATLAVTYLVYYLERREYRYRREPQPPSPELEMDKEK